MSTIGIAEKKAEDTKTNEGWRQNKFFTAFY